jgi:acetylglutamate kinase
MDAALGAVGRPVRSNPELLELLTGRGYLPVVACVAGDRQGRIYNVNADQMAAACASGFGADRLIFLTDVQGVLGPDQRVLPVLTLGESQALIDSGVATRGMRAKLDAAMRAVRAGVRQVVIAPGADPGIISALLDGQSAGSRLEEDRTHD